MNADAANPLVVNPLRTTAQRRRDTEEKLESHIDVWVASADGSGRAHLVPVSFYWDGSSLMLATAQGTRTAKNLEARGEARLALGDLRDVVLIDATVEAIPIGARPELEDAHAHATSFDPRTLDDTWIYLVLAPHVIQAWNSPEEFPGRHLMRGGRWLD